MTFCLDQKSFDALLPFSIVVDRNGYVEILGKSMRKLYPILTINDQFFDFFVLLQPTLEGTRLAPETLQGDTLVFHHINLPSLRLIGQAIKIADDSERFVFALKPLIQDVSLPSRYGLTIDDFAFDDSIFELLLLLRGEQLAQERAQDAICELAWANKISRILHEITLCTYELRTPSSVFDNTLKTVCLQLNWDVGHVFLLDEQSETTLIPSHIWFSSDQEAFRDFHAATLVSRYYYGEGIVGRSWQNGETVWSPNVKDNPLCNRALALHNIPCLTGVAVPIYIQDTIAAVIEFFTRDEKANEQRYRAFFGILGEHLGNVLSRQKASAREQEQSLQLASSAKMATLGKFAAGIAHEINDPLSTICTTVQILERMQHNAQKHSPDASLQPELEHLQRLHRGLKQIRRIISSLQSFSRDSSHDAYSKVSLAILVEHTIDLCSARFTNKGICLHIKPISPTLTIECRSSQISQVLLNLLTNAFDAAIDTTEKWVSLEVHEKDSEIEIWVTDSGQGIEPHLAGRIMSPFFTTKPPGKGTGLGLSIASSIISEHAGELFVNHSTPNTTFVIRLPRQAVRTAKAV